MFCDWLILNYKNQLLLLSWTLISLTFKTVGWYQRKKTFFSQDYSLMVHLHLLGICQLAWSLYICLNGNRTCLSANAEWVEMHHYVESSLEGIFSLLTKTRINNVQSGWTYRHNLNRNLQAYLLVKYCFHDISTTHCIRLSVTWFLR